MDKSVENNMKTKQQYHAASLSHQKRNNLELAATLDLHGYRKDDAIAQTTSFLEVWRKRRNSSMRADVCWVSIVTGSGQHSHDGPVLRDAVESLLRRRQMVYMMNPGRGSLTVNAKSGIVFYKSPQPVDTKLLLVGGSQSNVKLVGRPSPTSSKPFSTNFAKVPYPDDLTPETSTDSSNSSAAGQIGNNSVGGEEDDDLERILQTSKEEFEKKERKRDFKHQRAMRKAQDLSRAESEGAELEVGREEDMLRRALIQSEKEQAREQREEEAMLRQALAVSSQVPASSPVEPLSEPDLENAIQQAMAASLQDVNTTDCVLHQDDELERVLALSLADLSPEADSLGCEGGTDQPLI